MPQVVYGMSYGNRTYGGNPAKFHLGALDSAREAPAQEEPTGKCLVVPLKSQNLSSLFLGSYEGLLTNDHDVSATAADGRRRAGRNGARASAGPSRRGKGEV